MYCYSIDTHHNWPLPRTRTVVALRSVRTLFFPRTPMDLRSAQVCLGGTRGCVPVSLTAVRR